MIQYLVGGSGGGIGETYWAGVDYHWSWEWVTLLGPTLESLLDTEETKPVNPKRNQLWIFIGRTDAEATILWPPDAKSQFIGKDPNVRKEWRQKDRGLTEVKMVRQHHWLNGHELEQILGDSGGQGSLACCDPWGLKESDTIQQLHDKAWATISTL